MMDNGDHFLETFVFEESVLKLLIHVGYLHFNDFVFMTKGQMQEELKFHQTFNVHINISIQIV